MTTMKTKMLQPSIFLVLSIIAGVFCTITEASTREDVWQSHPDNPTGKADNKYPGNSKPVDCADIYCTGRKESGIYKIWPMSRVKYNKFIHVFCDMDTDGGGWTVIQRRGNFQRSDDFFYKDWKSYKEGFGNMSEDFWLGNDDIFALTNQKRYSVRFEMTDLGDVSNYSHYDEFWIDDENNKYTLHISGYKGEAGDSMTESHNNQKFSTYDQDNDNYEGNCAGVYKSGWWFHKCAMANFNGVYFKGKTGNYTGVIWEAWKGRFESLAWTEIKIRPSVLTSSE